MSDLRIAEKKFRPELEGIRVVAALLVAIYHIWLGSVSGGVDVFFIVSGYLITTSLISKMEKQGEIRYFEYVLGLMRRLFPIAFVVIFTSSILAFLLLPQTQWRQVISEMFSSAFYFQNWQLATNAVDYLAQNNEASPFQHFWALSLQGQFYITWPLVIFLAFIAAKKIFKTPPRKTLLALLSILFVASLTYSIYITNVNQPWAYFDTFARIWEFSLGGILALLIPYLAFNKSISTIMGWIGLIIICFTGMVLPVSTVFPGYVALLPTTGVILVILSAENAGRFAVKRFLGSKLLMFLGGFSYAFYLWHWPLLIFYYTYFNTETISTTAGIFIMSIALSLSIITTKLIESPIRRLSVKQSKVKLISILFLFIVPVVALNIAWGQYLDKEQQYLKEQYDTVDYPGARVLYDNIEAASDVKPIASLDPNNELPAFYTEDCYVYMNASGVKMCSYGETDNPEYTIALVGGSHSGHWFPALEGFADEMNIQIDVYNKDACRFSTQDFNGKLDDTCMEWNELVVEPLLESKPDLIFTTATVADGSTVPQGYIEMWEKFEGITNIFAIRDNPKMTEDIPTCVEVNGPEDCTVSRSEALPEPQPWEVTEGIPNNVYFADLSDYFCDDKTCQSVIGNVLVYRDDHHISTLYSKTLATPLKKEVLKALEQESVNNE
ncbi:acyltransferase family protein [Oceanobacillus halotolerans]|uniref:acyltransferase family protein n=1 Tax=Oceanobacillus halotolerans TaxID=2663380 RepID=UPI0013DD80E4|nr:acyltransferase family protein [Oceanobacillus halotolerans]